MRNIYLHVEEIKPGNEATFNVCNIQYYTNIIVAMSMQHCNYYITNLHYEYIILVDVDNPCVKACTSLKLTI